MDFLYRIYRATFTDSDGTILKEIYEYDDNGFLRSIRFESGDIERIHNYFYDSDGLLSKREDFRRGAICGYVEYEYETPLTALRKNDLFEKIPVKEIHRHPDGSVRYFHTFIFEESRLLKQTQHAPDGSTRYEYICLYENNKRVRTLKANLEVYSSRIYDSHGVLSEIRLSTGGSIVFSYEPRRTTYDFDRYTVT
jgi:hypothetical protein